MNQLLNRSVDASSTTESSSTNKQPESIFDVVKQLTEKYESENKLIKQESDNLIQILLQKNSDLEQKLGISKDKATELEQKMKQDSEKKQHIIDELKTKM